MTNKIRSVAPLVLAASCCCVQPFVSAFTTRPATTIRQPLSRPRDEPVLSAASFLDQLFPALNAKPFVTRNSQSSRFLQDFVARWNDNAATQTFNIDQLLDFFTDDAVWNDYSYHQVCRSKLDVARRFRLQSEANVWPRLVVDEASIVIDDATRKLAFSFRHDDNQQQLRGCAFMTLNEEMTRIETVDWVMEGSSKGGEASLRTLALASNVIGLSKSSNKSSEQNVNAVDVNMKTAALTPPEIYFEAWNRRDMEAAINLFSDDAVYDDTAFEAPFRGKEKLRNHLLLVAKAFPSSFAFIVDDLVSSKRSVAVKWHVENNGQELPFTQGCSIYKLDKSNKIENGIDFVTPGPVKPGGISLFIDSMKRKIQTEPVRLLPIATWIAYMYIVFFSDGILPGANALVLEQRTWEEVINLSLNFFLVAPLLHLPFSPVVHPMLEGVFNLLLAWAAMFAGFLSDDRRDKPNLFPMLPAVAGMQLLTSAFLLPYLATRSTETRAELSKDDVGTVARVCESPLLGVSMGLVGTGSIAWFVFGRMADFGVMSERWSTFLDLMSIDRVGSSFIVDLIIFGLFQGWLVNDDLIRRGMSRSAPFAGVAKYVPFFGLAAYLALRPSLPSNSADK
ncbi:hypothetical protein MPSEU_000916900 [Mayamaea pseudoterrestris]|nr:hypothetical protein MPSEU_000916900 [Mayamaea pseudoterrestris]